MGGDAGRHVCRPYWVLEVIPSKIGMFSLPGIGPTRAAGPTFKNCNIETRYRLNRSHLPVGAGSKPARGAFPIQTVHRRKKALGTVYARFQRLFSLFNLWQEVFL